jgi:hypothetical protein
MSDLLLVEAVVGSSVPKSRLPHPGGKMATQSPASLVLLFRRIFAQALL